MPGISVSSLDWNGPIRSLDSTSISTNQHPYHSFEHSFGHSKSHSLPHNIRHLRRETTDALHTNLALDRHSFPVFSNCNFGISLILLFFIKHGLYGLTMDHWQAETPAETYTKHSMRISSISAMRIWLFSFFVGICYGSRIYPHP